MIDLQIIDEIRTEKDIITVFNQLIKSVANDPYTLMEAKKYNHKTNKKYRQIMTETIETVTRELKVKGVADIIIQSSYSSNVFIDSPGDIDIDLVIPYDTELEFDSIILTLRSLGFAFSEIRNISLPEYIHWVFVRSYGDFIIEVKIRHWAEYKSHLFLIHKFLDSLPPETRMIWRYIRSLVADSEVSIRKKVKYLWYMYGAIMTNVRCDKESFPMNIYY